MIAAKDVQATQDVRALEVDDAEAIERTERRAFLKGGLLAVAGFIGLKQVDAATSPATAPGAASGTTFDLTGTRLRASGSDGAATGAQLVDEFGDVVGSFSATPLAATQPGAAQGAELQTFTTPEGMILGMGVPAPRGETTAVYAVIGGTGQFAGATGTYVAEQHPEHLGGDGTADWRFTIGR